jgi:[ribosomal protein S18]-alanine N-acetyltransferase
VVAPDSRRMGVATRLMSALAGTAIDRGCVAWTLEVRASNVAAQELYRQFGFAPAGVRKRYYENTEDAIVMWCHDIQSDAYADRLRSIAAREGGPA